MHACNLPIRLAGSPAPYVYSDCGNPPPQIRETRTTPGQLWVMPADGKRGIKRVGNPSAILDITFHGISWNLHSKWTAESQEFPWDYPVQVSILEFVVERVLFRVEPVCDV